MKGMIQLSAIGLALSISGAAMAQSPDEMQKMETAKLSLKVTTAQEINKHLMQNKIEQKQLQTALEHKQHEQLELMQQLENVKAAK